MIGDIVYPRRCPVCDDLLYSEGLAEKPMVCPECLEDLHFIREPYCMKCGKELEIDEREYCHDCALHRGGFAFQRGLACFGYTPAVKQSMYSMKNGRQEYAVYYGNQIVNRYEKVIRSWQPQALVPVPMHPAKLRKRGYNQAELLAKVISKRLNIPVCRALNRSKNTRAQKYLGDSDRINNQKNAFQLSEDVLKCEKLILVDDIYTTGNTINECARVLRNAGAESIYFLTACIGQGF